MFAPSLFDSFTATARPAKLSGKDIVCVVAAGNVVVQAQVLPIREDEVIAEREAIRSYGEY